MHKDTWDAFAFLKIIGGGSLIYLDKVLHLDTNLFVYKDRTVTWVSQHCNSFHKLEAKSSVLLTFSKFTSYINAVVLKM